MIYLSYYGLDWVCVIKGHSKTLIKALCRVIFTICVDSMETFINSVYGAYLKWKNFGFFWNANHVSSSFRGLLKFRYHHCTSIYTALKWVLIKPKQKAFLVTGYNGVPVLLIVINGFRIDIIMMHIIITVHKRTTFFFLWNFLPYDQIGPSLKPNFTEAEFIKS